MPENVPRESADALVETDLTDRVEETFTRESR